MKRIISVLLIILLVGIASVLGAQSRVLYSTARTDDALITTGAAEFHGITVTGDGTNSITVDIHNGLTTSGEKIAPTLFFPQSGTNKTQTYSVNPPVYCGTGIYVNITTSGTISYTVYYAK
jgi:hypothetical protein